MYRNRIRFACVITAALIAVQALTLSSSGRAFALVASLAFQPFIYAVSTGQFSPLLGLGLALLVASPARARSSPLAFALLIAKPQLTALLIAAASADLFRSSRKWFFLIGGGFLALVFVSLARFPDVLAVAGTGLGARVASQIRLSSSSWSLASSIVGDGWLILGCLFGLMTVGCWLAAVRWAPVAYRRAVMFAGASMVALVVAPVARSYDQVLLLPAIAVLVLLGEQLAGRARLIQRLIVLLTAVVLPWVLFVSAQLANSPARIAVVPLVFAAALFGSALALKNARGTQGRQIATCRSHLTV